MKKVTFAALAALLLGPIGCNGWGEREEPDEGLYEEREEIGEERQEIGEENGEVFQEGQGGVFEENERQQYEPLGE